ncbi:hypothetical protein [Amycolatopsis sp. cmx-11-32]|uniref:hypothetical protein n=1 Tax=Amycolatopsis sp. cmx-11-32 TaxID=2785796 RepID=UPI0039E3EDC1
MGAAIPSWLFGGSLKLGLGPITEVGYNHLGHTMSNTEALTLRQRPAGPDGLFVSWQTLSHADDPQ